MHSSIVEKLFKLLTIISEAREPLTFSELVQKTGLNKSTLHRLLAICSSEDLVHFDAHRKVYLMGPRVFDLVRNAFKGYDIQAIALDEMVQLFDMSQANVTVGIPSGLEVVYLRVLEQPQSMGGSQRPGSREPMHCSASGKVLLAFQPDKVVASRLNGYVFERFTDRTITDVAAFEADLSWARTHGFARNNREQYDHLLGIAAPIFNYNGDPIAVLNIWSVYQLHSMDDLLGWSDALKAAAARVTGLIGGTAPHLASLGAR